MHPSQLSKAQEAAFKQIDAACRHLAESSGQTYAPPPPANPQSPADLIVLQLSERVAALATLLAAERTTD